MHVREVGLARHEVCRSLETVMKVVEQPLEEINDAEADVAATAS